MLTKKLTLNVNPQGWRLFVARRTDLTFEKTRKNVLTRDQFCCQYCGIIHQHAQEIINLNGQYSDNSVENLITACVLCAQCGFLESVSIENYGGGVLVYLPELSQAAVNGFCYALFKAMDQQGQEEEIAHQYYRTLKLRTKAVEDALGTGMSEPAVFGKLLVESNLEQVSSPFLSHLKLLPSRTAFKKYMKD